MFNLLLTISKKEDCLSQCLHAVVSSQNLSREKRSPFAVEDDKLGINSQNIRKLCNKLSIIISSFVFTPRRVPSKG